MHQRIKDIDGLAVIEKISQITEPLDTVSMYVSADISSALENEILAKFPKRVIFNPGAENESLAQKLSQKGIKPVNACTLVMLRTNQF